MNNSDKPDIVKACDEILSELSSAETLKPTPTEPTKPTSSQSIEPVEPLEPPELPKETPTSTTAPTPDPPTSSSTLQPPSKPLLRKSDALRHPLNHWGGERLRSGDIEPRPLSVEAFLRLGEAPTIIPLPFEDFAGLPEKRPRDTFTPGWIYQDDVKADQWYCIPCSLTSPRRKAILADHVQTIFIDQDELKPDEDPIAAAQTAFDPLHLLYTVYTTIRHRPDEVRARTAIPTDGTIPATDYDLAVSVLRERLAISEIDPCSKVKVQPMLDPVHCEDASFLHYSNVDEAIDGDLRLFSASDITPKARRDFEIARGTRKLQDAEPLEDREWGEWDAAYLTQCCGYIDTADLHYDDWLNHFIFPIKNLTYSHNLPFEDGRKLLHECTSTQFQRDPDATPTSITLDENNQPIRVPNPKYDADYTDTKWDHGSQPQAEGRKSRCIGSLFFLADEGGADRHAIIREVFTGAIKSAETEGRVQQIARDISIRNVSDITRGILVKVATAKLKDLGCEVTATFVKNQMRQKKQIRIDDKMVRNFEYDEDGKAQPLGTDRIVEIVLKATDGALYAIGPELFTYVKGSPTVEPLSATKQLFAWLADITGVPPTWVSAGVGFLCKDEFYELLLRRVKTYKGISKAPHWPSREDTFYTHPPLPAPSENNRIFYEFCDFFCPATEHDRHMIPVYAASQFYYRDRIPRPIWIIDAPEGAGSGKSEFVAKMAFLVGEGTMDEAKPKQVEEKARPETLTGLEKRWVYGQGLYYRVLRIDNVKGFHKSQFITAKSTTPYITARAVHAKGDTTRLNDITYTYTSNTARYDNDIIQRAMMIHLKGASEESQTGWLERLDEFIEQYRWQIISDIFSILDAGPQFTAPRAYGRFDNWERQIAIPMCGTFDIYADLFKRNKDMQAEANSDSEEMIELDDGLGEWLKTKGIDPDTDSLFFYSAALQKLVPKFLPGFGGGPGGRHLIRHLKEMTASREGPGSRLTFGKSKYPAPRSKHALAVGTSRQGAWWNSDRRIDGHRQLIITVAPDSDELIVIGKDGSRQHGAVPFPRPSASTSED